MSGPCYYCELGKPQACEVCIHGEADPDDLRKDMQDAERYRWLRSELRNVSIGFDGKMVDALGVETRPSVRCEMPDIEGFDRAIDAARQQKGNNEPPAHVCKFEPAIDLKTLDGWQECACGRKRKAGAPYYR